MYKISDADAFLSKHDQKVLTSGHARLVRRLKMSAWEQQPTYLAIFF